MKTFTTVLLTLCALASVTKVQADIVTVTDFGSGIYIATGSQGSSTITSFGGGIYTVSPSYTPTPVPIPQIPMTYPGYPLPSHLPTSMLPTPAPAVQPVLPPNHLFVDMIENTLRKWDQEHAPKSPSTWSLVEYQRRHLKK